MKTLKKIIFISIVLGMISSLIISCKSDDKQQTGLLTLSILRGSIQNVAWTKCRTKYVKPLVHR